MLSSSVNSFIWFSLLIAGHGVTYVSEIQDTVIGP